MKTHTPALVFRSLFLLAILVTFNEQAIAGNCAVSLYEHIDQGGKHITINSDDFPYGTGGTFQGRSNIFENTTGMLQGWIDGDFSPDDVFFVAGFPVLLTTEYLDLAGEQTIGLNVGSLFFDLRTQVDAAGNLVGVSTGALILSEEELYQRAFGDSGWGPLDWNDEVSSYGMSGDCAGTKLTLFWDSEFLGEQLEITYGDGDPNLRDWDGDSFSDNVSSYRISFGIPGDCMLRMYDGSFVRTVAGVGWNLPDDATYSSHQGSHKISSLSFDGACGNSEVLLYETPNRTDTPVHIRAADNAAVDLMASYQNNTTRAWTVNFTADPPVPSPPPRPYCGVKLWDDIRYTSHMVTTLNTWRNPQISTRGFANIGYVEFDGECGSSYIVLHGLPGQGDSLIVRSLDGSLHNLSQSNWSNRAAGWTMYFSNALPDIVGMPVAQGLAEIQGAGLLAVRADVAYTQDPELTGTIYSVTPPAGTEMEPGETVYYVEYRSSVVPDVITMPVADGVALIQASAYPTERADFAATHDENLVGKIHSTIPGTGATLTPGETVYYIEYKYLAPATPDVVNWTTADAVDRIQSDGFTALRVDFVDTYDANLEDKIHSTTPAAGAALPGGGTVHYIEYRFTPAATFHEKPGGAIDIGAGGSNYGVWVIGTGGVDENGNQIFYWDSNAWIQVAGAAARIDVGPDGQAWVVQNGGQIYHMENGNWVLKPGLATDIGVGENGDVWIIGTNPVAAGPYDIWRWNGTNWDDVPGGAARIDVGPEGNPWIVQEGGQIYEFVNDTWELRPGLASDISIGGDGSVWIIGTNPVAGGPNDIYRWNGSSWDLVPGGAAAVSVDVLGQPWVVQGGGEIYWGSLNN